jgi:excisionase family DNA binding protein
MEKLLTIKEVAEALTLSPFTIKRMLKNGVLPFVRINRNVIRIRGEDLERLVQLRLTRTDYWKASQGSKP